MKILPIYAPVFCSDSIVFRKHSLSAEPLFDSVFLEFRKYSHSAGPRGAGSDLAKYNVGFWL